MDAKLHRLNTLLARPVDTYAAPGAANIGNIHLGNAHGGWYLEVIANEGGGVHVMLDGQRHTAREMYDILSAMIVAIELKA
jgi:ribulose 1,5-bisphosphate carboxylase large subunit-like protein